MLGCDFEGFVRLKGKYVPAERVLGGSKDSPVGLSRGVVGHPDNVMAEAAIAAPVEPESFNKSVKAALDRLREFINPAEFCCLPSLKFTQDWLDACKYSNEVGCEPDFDTVGGRYQYSPRELGLYRYAGFHIHFDVMDSVPPDYAAQIVDCTVGLASIAFEWDTNQGNRRRFYGTPGRHRPKPYGIEYRTLSSSMLEHLDEAQPIIEAVARGMESADERIMMLPQLMWDAASEAIKTEDVEMAKALWEQVRLK